MFCLQKKSDDYLRRCSKWPPSFAKQKVALFLKFCAALIRVSLETFLAHNSTIFLNWCRLLRIMNRLLRYSPEKNPVDSGLGTLQARKIINDWRQRGFVNCRRKK